MKLYDITKANSIDWAHHDIAPLSGEMAEDLVAFITRATRYITQTWWRAKGFGKMEKANYLTIKTNIERVVLPMANAAKTVAIASKYGILDDSDSRKSTRRALDRGMKLLRSVCYYNAANMANGWRSYQVCAECGMAGLLMWDKLNATDRNLFVNMLDYTATELLDTKPQYRSIEDNKELRPTQHNFACAKVLLIAAHLMIAHDKKDKFVQKAQEFCKVATAMAHDEEGIIVEKKGKKSGVKPVKGEQLYNFTQEGLAYRGDVVDVDEMLSVSDGLELTLIFVLYNQQPPQWVLGNAGKIYGALNNLYVSRNRRSWEPIYARREDGQPLAELNVVNKVAAKPDRGQVVRAYLMDAMAYCYDYDSCCDIPSRQWAETRMNKMLIRQKAHARMTYYPDIRGKNQSKEVKIAALAAQAYAMLYFKAAEKIKQD